MSEGRDGLSPTSTAHVAPAQKRAALLADIAGGGGGLSAGLRHVSFKPRPIADPHAAVLAGTKGGSNPTPTPTPNPTPTPTPTPSPCPPPNP